MSATVPRCNFPAQDLMSLNEMREHLADGTLPEGFRARVTRALDGRVLAESENVHCAHTGEFTLLSLLSWDEMASYLQNGHLPVAFPERVRQAAEQDCCVNCGGQQCMGCVFREYDHTCSNDCPDCC